MVHMDLLLRGRHRTWCYTGATSAWQVQHFDSLAIAGARLDATGARLLLRGKCNIWCTWTYFCVAGTTLGATGATFAWQVQHFDSLGIAAAPLRAVGARLLVRGRRSTWCTWTYFCVAGAALGGTGATSAWQVQHFDYLAIGGARLGAAEAR